MATGGVPPVAAIAAMVTVATLRGLLLLLLPQSHILSRVRVYFGAPAIHLVKTPLMVS